MVVPPAIKPESGPPREAACWGLETIHKQRVASVYPAFHFCRRHLDGIDDVRVSAAPAKVARHEFSNLAVRTGAAFVDTSNRRHDLTRCAITALKPVALYEGSLNRMQSGGGLFGRLSSVTATPRASGAATVKPAEIAAKRRMNWRREEPSSWFGSASAGSSISRSDLRCISLKVEPRP